jgi:hypothetical protein
LFPRRVDELLKKLEEIDIVRFRYKDETAERRPHIGVIAEEAPRDFVAEDGRHLEVVDVMGFLLATTKALALRLREVENGRS